MTASLYIFVIFLYDIHTGTIYGLFIKELKAYYYEK